MSYNRQRVASGYGKIAQTEFTGRSFAWRAMQLK
jgi:hypothetical protein